VEGIYPSESRLAENFILQRTASHGIELLGILAFRASPVWVLAALADVQTQGFVSPDQPSVAKNRAVMKFSVQSRSRVGTPLCWAK